MLAICKKLGLEPMIWSDMYITANTNGRYYEVPADADCSSWEKPEKGLGLVYWDYYYDDEKFYEKMLNIHKQLSDDVIFAGLKGSLCAGRCLGIIWCDSIPDPGPSCKDHIIG